MDFNKTFHITSKEIQKQIEHIHKVLTWNKYCCVCANAEKRQDEEMGYGIETTWCKITGEYRDNRCGNNCQSWKAKYPEYER